jgi:hypothetical protein
MYFHIYFGRSGSVRICPVPGISGFDFYRRESGRIRRTAENWVLMIKNKRYMTFDIMPL